MHSSSSRTTLGLIAGAACLFAPGALAQDSAAQPAKQEVAPERPMHAVERLRREAAKLRNIVERDATRMALFATSWLPVVSNRTVMYNETTRDAKSIAEFKQLEPEQQAGFKEIVLDDKFYYYTRYGSPMAYARPFDLLAALEPEKKNYFQHKKVLDFGFGGVGQLRLLALLGADVVGVEVDPILKALYSLPEDQGEVRAAVSMGADVSDGRMALLYGKWPAELKTEVGGEYDVIISKNVLKRGYIHPEQTVDPKMLVNLGATDDEFVSAVAQALKPGGVLMIYNIHPKQKEEAKDYRPWADGRCPFPRELLESHGFEVLAFDQDDTTAIKPIARALGWDGGEGAMDIEGDLFATYTLVRKKNN